MNAEGITLPPRTSHFMITCLVVILRTESDEFLARGLVYTDLCRTVLEFKLAVERRSGYAVAQQIRVFALGCRSEMLDHQRLYHFISAPHAAVGIVIRLQPPPPLLQLQLLPVPDGHPNQPAEAAEDAHSSTGSNDLPQAQLAGADAPYEEGLRDAMESLDPVLMYFLRGSLPWQGSRAGAKRAKLRNFDEKKVSTSTEALCRGSPSEFVSNCTSLWFHDKPGDAYPRRTFDELFIREGFPTDCSRNWTTLNYQQSQMSILPIRSPATIPGPSGAAPLAITNGDKQTGSSDAGPLASGGEEGRALGWSLVDDSSCRRPLGPATDAGSLSKQKSPVATDLAAVAMSRDNMLSSSNHLGRSCGSSRWPAVSSSQHATESESADLSQPCTTEASSGFTCWFCRTT